MNPLLMVALAAVIVFVLSRSLLRRGDISGTEARAAVAAGARLVDVRTAAEFAGGHLPGALHLPLHEIGSRARTLGDTSGTVIVYCMSGHRSRQAKRMLEAQGFTTVRDLGAMRYW